MKRQWHNHYHDIPNYLLHYRQWTSRSSSFRSKSQSRLCPSRSSWLIFMSLLGSSSLSWYPQKNYILLLFTHKKPIAIHKYWRLTQWLLDGWGPKSHLRFSRFSSYPLPKNMVLELESFWILQLTSKNSLTGFIEHNRKTLILFNTKNQKVDKVRTD